MSKVILNSVSDITQSTTAQTTINTNFSTIQTAFDNTLSLNGTAPNQMSAAIDMNSNQIFNLPAPSTVNSPARLIDVTTNPTIVVPGTGTSGHTVPFLDGINTWSGQQTTTSRTIINYTPVFDLASNVLSVAFLYKNISITVPASGNYQDIRFTNEAGTSPTFTIGAGGVAANIYSSPVMGASSDVAATLYGAVIQATNAGPGTVKGLHGGVFGSGSSTGSIIAANLQIQPVATQGYTAGGFASLTSSGVNGKAIAYGVESTGDQYLFAMGNTINALPISSDYIRWWQHASSAAGANFLNLLASDGVTTNFKVDKAGNTTTLGIITGASLTTTGAHTAFSGTAVPAGGTTGTGIKMSSTSNLGMFFGSGAPTLSAAQGSFYLRTDGSSVSTRMYINTNGSTTWTNVTTAA